MATKIKRCLYVGLGGTGMNALLHTKKMFIDTYGEVPPMIGFLGTVSGMIRAFFNMSNAGNNVDISLLSSGIYEAMVTTVGGLVVGIIAYFAYNFLVERIDRVADGLDEGIEEFMDLLQQETQEQK